MKRLNEIVGAPELHGCHSEHDEWAGEDKIDVTFILKYSKIIWEIRGLYLVLLVVYYFRNLLIKFINILFLNVLLTLIYKLWQLILILVTELSNTVLFWLNNLIWIQVLFLHLIKRLITQNTARMFILPGHEYPLSGNCLVNIIVHTRNHKYYGCCDNATQTLYFKRILPCSPLLLKN